MCMASNQKKYVDSSKCEMSQKPAITQRCNVKTCPGPEWKAGEWEAVSGESVRDQHYIRIPYIRFFFACIHFPLCWREYQNREKFNRINLTQSCK